MSIYSTFRGAKLEYLTTYNSISDCLDENSKVVFVYNPEVAACNALFSYYPQEFTVTFTSEATGEFSQHFWDFNDGTNSNQESPVHTYAQPGYYEVAYTVIDTTNCSIEEQVDEIIGLIGNYF